MKCSWVPQHRWVSLRTEPKQAAGVTHLFLIQIQVTFHFAFTHQVFCQPAWFLQLLGVAAETGVTRSEPFHFLIYRKYLLEHMNSSRSQREAQEVLSVKEPSQRNSQFPAQPQSSPAVISGAGKRKWPQEKRRAKSTAFSTTNRVKDKRWDKLCFTKCVAQIKTLPRRLKATVYSAQWNLKGFLVQLGCFSIVQPSFKYLLSIENRLDTACRQS